jgi:hypothetical protein
LRCFRTTNDEFSYHVQQANSRDLILIVSLRQRTCRNTDCRKPLEGAPPRQIYCSQSCASSGRKAVLPKVPAARFDALAKNAFYGTKTRTAVRLVLVGGKSQTEAASLTGMSIYSVHRAMKRFLAKFHVPSSSKISSCG